VPANPAEGENHMGPYEYTEPVVGGGRLSIWPHNAGAALVRVYDGDTATVSVPSSKVPAAALALYEAAGLSEPVILERPKSGSAAILSEGGGELVTVSASPRGGPMNLPGVMLSTGGVGVRLIRDEPLRLAWQLVGAMREAEAEPDAAEVEALAQEIHQPNCDAGEQCGPHDDERRAARALLLGGWKREPER
jgi:hypothetical protein